jgi:hypothetical protein
MFRIKKVDEECSNLDGREEYNLTADVIVEFGPS